jgi:hypothetical protein
MISETDTVYSLTQSRPINVLGVYWSNYSLFLSIFVFFNGAFNCSDYVPSNEKAINELWFRKMFKDAAVAYFTARCLHMFGEAEEIHDTLRIMCLRVQMWSWELQDTKQEF